MSLQTPSQALLRSTQLLGLTTSLVCSGVNFCASYLTIPLLTGLPTATSTKAFASLYKRGIPVLVPLAIISGLSSAVLAYWTPEQRTLYALAGAATCAPLPWTQLVMMSTNMRLVGLSEEEREREKVSTGEVDDLLRSWQWKNYVRAGLALTGGLVGAWTSLNLA